MEKARWRAVQESRCELKQLLKQGDSSVTVGSKFKGKIEKERKVGRGFRQLQASTSQSLEKHVTVGMGSSFSVFQSFPCFCLPLCFPRASLLMGTSEQQLAASGSWEVTSCTCDFFLSRYFFFKCLPGGSSWLGWFERQDSHYPIQKDWSAKVEWHLL